MLLQTEKGKGTTMRNGNSKSLIIVCPRTPHSGRFKTIGPVMRKAIELVTKIEKTGRQPKDGVIDSRGQLRLRVFEDATSDGFLRRKRTKDPETGATVLQFQTTLRGRQALKHAPVAKAHARAPRKAGRKAA